MITVKDRIDFLKYVKMYVGTYSIGVEIGVLHGDFSHMILNILDPNQLLLIDPYVEEGKWYKEIGVHTSYSTESDYQKVTERFQEELKSGKFFMVRNFSHRVVNDFENYVFDFVYHDASHAYGDIKRDLVEWMPKLNENRGLMCGHDYIEHPDFGVIQAVDEFCKEYNFEMIILNTNGGDYALKRK